MVPTFGRLLFFMAFHINIPKVIDSDDQQKIDFLKMIECLILFHRKFQQKSSAKI